MLSHDQALGAVIDSMKLLTDRQVVCTWQTVCKAQQTCPLCGLGVQLTVDNCLANMLWRRADNSNNGRRNTKMHACQVIIGRRACSGARSAGQSVRGSNMAARQRVRACIPARYIANAGSGAGEEAGAESGTTASVEAGAESGASAGAGAGARPQFSGSQPSGRSGAPICPLSSVHVTAERGGSKGARLLC